MLSPVAGPRCKPGIWSLARERDSLYQHNDKDIKVMLFQGMSDKICLFPHILISLFISFKTDVDGFQTTLLHLDFSHYFSKSDVTF